MQSDTVTFTAQPGALSNCIVVPDNFRTRKSTPYTFQFTITNSLAVDSRITIIVPADITATSTALRYTGLQTVSTAGTLVYDTTSRTIILSNMLATAVEAPVSIKFEISAGFTNPISAKETEAFVISTTDALGSIIDQNSTVTLTATAEEITSVEVRSCTSEPSYTSQLCTYQLLIK